MTYPMIPGIAPQPPSSRARNLSYLFKELIEAAETKDPELTSHDIRTALQLAQPSHGAFSQSLVFAVIGTTLVLVVAVLLYLRVGAG